MKKKCTPNYASYKECLEKGVDALDGEYIDWKINENFEEISPQWKKNMKEEILEELKKDTNKKFEEMKKAYEDIQFSDEDIMDIVGHGQVPKQE